MLKTTVGQILVNDALPEDLRDYHRELDKTGSKELFRQLAEKYPERYREVSKALADIGRQAATEFGGYSFGLQHLRKSKAAKANNARLQAKLDAILANDSLNDQTRNDQIVKTIQAAQKQHIGDIYDEAVQENNPLAMQVVSGSRGNKGNLASLLGSDLLYVDHRDRPLPLAVTRSYSEGLTPMEYLAGTFGARKGVLATKLATADAGYFSKRISQTSHRLMVVDDEDNSRDLKGRGMPVEVDDPDSAGALLASDYGPYKRNVVLTPKILRHLKSMGHDNVLIRSPIVGGSLDGGVFSRDLGVREDGRLAGRGTMTGFTGAQAIGEPTSQGQLSTKHSGGVAGQEKAHAGFPAIDQLVEVPKTFKGGAAHADRDGTVDRIEQAPAGGHYVWVDGQRHYASADVALKVKAGDKVEAGDVLTTGEPNPATIVKHKGIGEGRRYFAYAFRDAMRAAGMNADRRNTELLARGLINHVRLTDEWEDYVPDDTVLYSTMEHLYKPREGHVVTKPERALGQYLEKPVLHYSVGTRIRPSVLAQLRRFKVPEIAVHRDPPPFEPEMIRASASLQHDPDWLTRWYGSGLKSGLLDAVHRGATSDETGTSFVPGLARGVDFGHAGRIQQPAPGLKPPAEGTPVGAPSLAPSKPRGLFGLLKQSAQQASCVAKPPSRMQAISLIKLGKPPRQVQQIKTAKAPAGNNQSNPGSSTIDTSGSKALPPAPAGGAVAAAPKSVTPAAPTFPAPPSPPVSAAPAPPQASPYAPAEAFAKPVPPNQVHPDRATAYGQFPHGLLQPGDDFQQAMQYVTGNSTGNPDEGFGGELGAAIRLGSLVDTRAIGSLTAGPNYRGGYYQSGDHHDDLLGGYSLPAQGQEQSDWLSTQPAWVQQAMGLRSATPPAIVPPPPAPAPASTAAAQPAGATASVLERAVMSPVTAPAVGKAVAPIGGATATLGKAVAKRVFGVAEEKAMQTAAAGLAKQGLKTAVKKAPGIGWVLEVYDAANTPPDVLRQKFNTKMQTNPDAGVGDALWYFADNALNPGQNVGGAVTALDDAGRMRQDSKSLTIRATAQALASAEDRVKHLTSVSQRRSLLPEEQQALQNSQAQVAKIRADFKPDWLDRNLGKTDEDALLREDFSRQAQTLRESQARLSGQTALPRLYDSGTSVLDQENARAFAQHAIDGATMVGHTLRTATPETAAQAQAAYDQRSSQLSQILILATEHQDAELAQKAQAALAAMQSARVQAP